MRSKNILSIAAFTIAFVFSTVFAGLFIAKSVSPSVLTAPVVSYDNRQPTSCFKKRSSYTANKIKVFINLDDSIGSDHQQINSRIDRESRPLLKSPLFFKYKNSVAEYVETVSNLDESGLPEEFQAAWRDHAKAWQNYAAFLETLKSGSARVGFSDEEAEQIQAPYSENITATYKEVLRVGRDYGADVY